MSGASLEEFDLSLIAAAYADVASHSEFLPSLR